MGDGLIWLTLLEIVILKLYFFLKIIASVVQPTVFESLYFKNFCGYNDFLMRRKIFYILLTLLSLGIFCGSFALKTFLESLPNIGTLESYLPQLTTRILDHKGQLVSEFFTERRAWVSLNDIPLDLQNAFLAIEDDQFYEHWGISPQGMLRAAIKNFLSGRASQGGSTITQQLSKLIFLTQEKTITRKIKELLLALQIEREFSKEEILQIYLNQVYFGHGAYGVSAAAKIFFAKKVQDLTLSESSLLAGLPRLPQYYSPILHLDRAEGRQSIVLRRMQELKFISPEEAKLAKQSRLQIKRSPLPTTAPYFVEYLRQTLEPKYGNELLYRGGLTIQTTLDLNLQNSAEKTFIAALEQFDKEYGPSAELLRAKEKSKELKYAVKPSTTVTKIQGSLLVIDPKTGGIRALIGGRNFSESQFNRATQSKRQPGSTFKPFVWLTALEEGYTPATILEDLPIAFQNDGQDWRLIEGATTPFLIQKATSTLKEDQVWVPNNYDNKYFGPLTLRRALAFSRNLISVRLIYQIRPQKVIERCKKLGILSHLDPVISLSLGTSVVNLLELVSAFGTFAGEGIYKEPYAITKITDFQGQVLEENFPQEKEVISPQINYLMTSLLRSVVTEGTGRGAKSLDAQVAGKTGTSQDQRDLWFIGFTPEIVCGAWMGYDDFAPLGKKLSAGGILVPWWTEIMRDALKMAPSKDTPVPEGITFVKIDRLTGALAIPSCPKVALEAFKTGTEPKEFCPVDHSKKQLLEMETEE